MAAIEEPAAKLLSGKNHAVVSTLRKDGSVHNTLVWIGVENGNVTLNSAEGRAWPANVRRDPRVTITVYDPQNPYEYVEIRGRVTGEETGEAADRHIDQLAKKYLDADTYPFRQEGEQRIKFVVEPERVRHQAAG